MSAAFSAALAAVGDLGQAMATRGRARGAGGEGSIAGILLDAFLIFTPLANRPPRLLLAKIATARGCRTRCPEFDFANREMVTPLPL